MLAIDGHIFQQKRTSDDLVQWRCRQFRAPNHCRATCTSDLVYGQIHIRGEHNHPGDPSIINVFETIQSLKDNCRTVQFFRQNCSE